MRAAVAYLRYSTSNQTENSIAYQLDAVQGYCKRLDYVLSDIYTDEAQSGTNTDRDGLQRMMIDAEQHKFDAIVIYDQSRLSRNVVDWFSLREKMRQLDIKICSCTEDIEESDNPSAFLSEGVKALINQHFVMETRKKTIAGQTSRARQGKFNGGTPPLGYNVVDGDYIINDHEAIAVRLIYDMYADGYSYGNIVDELAKRGYRSKREAVIGTNALNVILQNERYIGIYFWNTRFVKRFKKWAGGQPNPEAIKIQNGMPSIIDMPTWERVKKRMSNNKMNASNRAKRTYLLSGLLRCGKCGALMCGITHISGKGYETSYYVCGNKYRNHTCDAQNLSAKMVEREITESLFTEILDIDSIDKYSVKLSEAIESFGDNNKDREEGIKKELTQRKRELTNLVSAMKQGHYTNTVQDAIDETEAQVSILENQLREIKGSQQKPVDKGDIIIGFIKDLQEAKESPEKLKAIIKKHIVGIKVIDNRNLEIATVIDYANTNGCGGAQYSVLTYILSFSKQR